MKEQLQKLKEVIAYIESIECDDGNDKLGKAHYHIKEAFELLEDFTEPPNTQMHMDNLKPGEPCSHPGCCHHITHPCEGCGRIGCQ